MPTYTDEAFRWSGTGYNQQYTTSYTVALTDNDGAYNGGSDASEQVTINGAGPYPTAGAAFAINVSFVATDSNTYVETFYFFNANGGGGWYFLPGPGSKFTVGATLGSYQSHTVGWNYTDVVCFTPGALIAVPTGGCLVENLSVGDLVVTKDNGLQAIRWIGKKRMSGARLMAFPNLAPIRVKKGALGGGLPDQDLSFSPQHRLLLSGAKYQLSFGQREILAPAKALLNDHDILVETGSKGTEYIHILFDQHEIVYANGIPTESFHPGAVAIGAVEEAARQELFEIFPELAINPMSFGDTARLSLSYKHARAFA